MFTSREINSTHRNRNNFILTTITQCPISSLRTCYTFEIILSIAFHTFTARIATTNIIVRRVSTTAAYRYRKKSVLNYFSPLTFLFTIFPFKSKWTDTSTVVGTIFIPINACSTIFAYDSITDTLDYSITVVQVF